MNLWRRKCIIQRSWRKLVSPRFSCARREFPFKKANYFQRIVYIMWAGILLVNEQLGETRTWNVILHSAFNILNLYKKEGKIKSSHMQILVLCQIVSYRWGQTYNNKIGTMKFEVVNEKLRYSKNLSIRWRTFVSSRFSSVETEFPLKKVNYFWGVVCIMWVGIFIRQWAAWRDLNLKRNTRYCFQ